MNQLQRRLNRDERLFEHVSGELSKIEEIIGRGSTACIQVERVVNGGVTIAVDEKETVVSKPVEHVEYYHSLDYDAVMTRTL